MGEFMSVSFLLDRRRILFADIDVIVARGVLLNEPLYACR